MPHADTQLTEALAALSAEEKVRLLTGRDFWSTMPIERIGLRSIHMSDGPSGVRGAVCDERDSLNLPSPTALAATWDRALARRYGAALAAEARRKDIDVVLGPTINLHRSAKAGRNFESFSEDPLLTAELAAAYIRGLQDNGVGAAVKHFVGNDSETDRFTVDVRIAERALREVYLLPFEKAVTEAGAWLVMSAYNSVNGTLMTENPLLRTPLRSEWGFDGVVVSDWGAVRSLDSARAGQDLVMPGPGGPWGEALLNAVRRGDITEEMIDEKVLRILRLAQRVGALGGDAPGPPLEAPEDGAALARAVAAQGAVLLENDGELPWNGSELTSLAVIGAHAAHPRTQGGGSATVAPGHTVSPLEGLRAALPHVAVTHTRGPATADELIELPLNLLTNPVTGGPGVRTRFLDADGNELYAEDRRATALLYAGGDAPVTTAVRFQMHTRYTPEATGPLRLGFALDGDATLYADGEPLVSANLAPAEDFFTANLFALADATAELNVRAGEQVELRLDYDLTTRSSPMYAMAVRLGSEPAMAHDDELIAEAARAAAAADVAVVVVGTTARIESEGHDRLTLDLPGRQDDLVKAVAAANPRTVVLVNAGAPVLMPWRKEVAAVLLGHFGGQEFGHAMADVLLGTAEPGGRLTTTWPDVGTDGPVADTMPQDGVLHYREGIHIGHRAWFDHHATPAYPFGHGRGYADIAIADVYADGLDVVTGGETLTVQVTVRNRSPRSGKQVVQVYAAHPESALDRPERRLVGFEAVYLAAGGTVTVPVDIDTRQLAHWDGQWCYEPGRYALHIGTDAATLPYEMPLTLSAADAQAWATVPSERN
ncbi:glycoside hydrolase family 3 C-terminal domain-containing protein [Streptomyces sp. NPDC013978]|uniref:glycoside hydrolase family 3 C-terminal domain-containing protein n=1 Tax=Streptomyces sp. NPDC013978 TaxID=3364869 RepID=UPI0036FD6BB1